MSNSRYTVCCRECGFETKDFDKAPAQKYMRGRCPVCRPIGSSQLDPAGDALRNRRADNAKKEKINNASLYAGSPMYYYCHSCDEHVATLPECHISAPPRFCSPC